MLNKNNILKSVSDEDERMIFAKALDKANLTIKTNRAEFTDFMDPFKAHKLAALCKNSEVNSIAYGGSEDAERLKIGFFPTFETENLEDFPISYIEIAYNGKYSKTLTHREFLGSILGLGITRDKVGDIVVEEDRAIAFVDNDIADYIVVNLERVSHTKVKTKILESFVPPGSEKQEKKLTVASLRIDAILSGTLNISRGKAAELIKVKKAFINWQQVISTSKTVQEGDTITLRGFGRVKIKQILGTTKKDRLLINVEIYK